MNGTITSAASRNVADGGTSNMTSSADDRPSTSTHADSSHHEFPGTETGSDVAGSETYLVKPMLEALYSINPFCIPVKYLGLQQQTSSDSVELLREMKKSPSIVSSPSARR